MLKNILTYLLKELHGKFSNAGVTSYVLHPGVVVTELGRHSLLIRVFYAAFGWLALKTPTEGAQTSIYCAVEEGIEGQSGSYFADCAVKDSSKQSCDLGVAKKLWELSEGLTRVECPL